MTVLGLVFLAIITVTLPLYWILEPGRQAGAEKDFVHKFETWGSGLFAATAEGGFNCAGCHGGMNATGGVASYAVTDPKTGEVKAVSWKAPALNTVLYRFNEEEVRFILNYGRPFSPMSAWGTIGGGPLTDQAITPLIDYMKSIQIPQEGCTETRAYYNPTCDEGQMLHREETGHGNDIDRVSWLPPQISLEMCFSSGQAIQAWDEGNGCYSAQHQDRGYP